MKTGQRPLRSLPYCFALLHEKSRPPEGERRYTKLNDFIQTTKFRKYLVVIGVIQIGTFHAYMLYYLRIAQIRNGRFLAEVLSDVMHKKSATSELE